MTTVEQVWLITGAIGLACGIGVGLLISVLTHRRIERERDAWRFKAGVLIGALRPFTSVRVRKIRFTPGARYYYWSCAGCRPHGLVGVAQGSDDLGPVVDEAREHYLDEHLTGENIRRADAALQEALGPGWRTQ